MVRVTYLTLNLGGSPGLGLAATAPFGERGEVTHPLIDPSLNDSTNCGFTHTSIPSAILHILGPSATLQEHCGA